MALILKFIFHNRIIPSIKTTLRMKDDRTALKQYAENLNKLFCSN
jgi:hypothetical protein